MIDFSSVSLTSFGGKLLRGILTLLPDRMILRVIQGPLKGKKWTKGSGVNGYWLGSFELDKVDQFASNLGEGQVVYDIGANVGYYTLISSIGVGKGGRVFAFEPLPANIDYLNKHLEINHVMNVNIFSVAVSDSEGIVRFDKGPNRFMGRISSDGEIEVKMISLDSLYEHGKIQLPDLIKIDVEGAELEVLRGAKKLILASTPTIFLATHDKNLPGVHRGCIKFLQNIGYHVESINKDVCVDETTELIARFEG